MVFFYPRLPPLINLPEESDLLPPQNRVNRAQRSCRLGTILQTVRSADHRGSQDTDTAEQQDFCTHHRPPLSRCLQGAILNQPAAQQNRVTCASHISDSKIRLCLYWLIDLRMISP